MRLHPQADLTLWVRVRLAATSLYLQAEPTLVERARECLEEAEKALSLVGTPVLQQESRMLRAYLAFADGRVKDARVMYDDLMGEGEILLTYRDRVRLSILDSQLLIKEGSREQGIRRLKELGTQARHAANIDLAADIWRVLAEALEG
jgi:hypothetical protein